MSKLKKMLTTPIKSLYLTSALLVILIALYMSTDIKYVPQLVLKQPSEQTKPSSQTTSPAISLSTPSIAATTSTADKRVSILSVPDVPALQKDLLLEINNASGSMTIQILKGLERIYRLDAQPRIVTLNKTQADENSPPYYTYTGTFERQPNDDNPIAGIEALEGRMDFKSDKEAIEWLNSDANVPFDFVYTDNGFVAGWYRTKRGTGSLIRVQVWQLYINGEMPVKLVNGQSDNFRFDQKAIRFAMMIPPIAPRMEHMKKNRKNNIYNMKVMPLDDQGKEYCRIAKTIRNLEIVELDPKKEGIAIAFLDKKDEQIPRTLGRPYLHATLDYLKRNKDAINISSDKKINNPNKIHMTWSRKFYHVPTDISDWFADNRYAVIKTKWFRFKESDYLYMSAGFDGKGFIMEGLETPDIMLKTEAIYQFANNEYKELIRGDAINVLKIENDVLIIGERSEGYDDGGGQIIAFDGSKSRVLCNWGFGL